MQAIDGIVYGLVSGAILGGCGRKRMSEVGWSDVG